jgi:hypothetical protein
MQRILCWHDYLAGADCYATLEGCNCNPANSSQNDLQVSGTVLGTFNMRFFSMGYSVGAEAELPWLPYETLAMGLFEFQKIA